MLHIHPSGSDFDTRRQLGEPSAIVSSTAGSTYLSKAYTGWPGRS